MTLSIYGKARAEEELRKGWGKKRRDGQGKVTKEGAYIERGGKNNEEIQWPLEVGHG